MSRPMRIGIVGCGAISGAYLQHARQFPSLLVTACADLDADAARRKAAEFGVPRVLSADELFADRATDVVLNLTPPKSHAAVAMRALEAGKHVYSEKPLGVTREEGRAVLDVAAARGLRVGCAPDTVLGAGVQTARHVLDGGAIGRPVAFTAFMMGRGHESWHPSPEFYYEPGGGPMFDMGPYYLTALMTLFGPIRRLSGAVSIALPERTITSQPKAGQRIAVRTPDHVCGTIEFANGVVGTIIQSFATWHPTYDEAHPITVYGTDGTMRVPDPNLFDGTVSIRRAADAQWQDVAPTSVGGYGRGVGLADMAEAIAAGRPHRAAENWRSRCSTRCRVFRLRGLRAGARAGADVRSPGADDGGAANLEVGSVGNLIGTLLRRAHQERLRAASVPHQISLIGLALAEPKHSTALPLRRCGRGTVGQRQGGAATSVRTSSAKPRSGHGRPSARGAASWRLPARRRVAARWMLVSSPDHFPRSPAPPRRSRRRGPRRSACRRSCGR